MPNPGPPAASNAPLPVRMIREPREPAKQVHFLVDRPVAANRPLVAVQMIRCPNRGSWYQGRSGFRCCPGRCPWCTAQEVRAGQGRSAGGCSMRRRNYVARKCRVMQFTVCPQCRSLRGVINDSGRAKLRRVFAEIGARNTARANCFAQCRSVSRLVGSVSVADCPNLLPLPLHSSQRRITCRDDPVRR